MHAPHNRLIAYYIFLISHSLVGCYNPDIVAGQKQLSQHIQEKRHEATPDIEGEEQLGSLSIADHSLSQAATLEKMLTAQSDVGLSLIVQAPAGQRYIFLKEIDKTASLSSKMQRKQQESIVDVTNDALNEEAEQLIPVFMTREGIQVQFVITTPHATQASIVDQFGMTYYVPVRYENNIPIPLEELAKKVANKEWCKSNIHLLNLQGEKCVFIGKQGLLGGGNAPSTVKCNECGLTANVTRSKRGGFLWLYRTNYYNCPYCAQKEIERERELQQRREEQRRREEQQRREEQCRKEEQQRREEERRSKEEEQRKKEEEQRRKEKTRRDEKEANNGRESAGKRSS